MPKMKTHKSTSKRFRKSKGGKGKVMRTRQGQSHFRRKKASRTKNLFGKMHEIRTPGTKRRISRLAPYLHKK